MSTHASIVLEPAAQAGPIDKPDVEEEWILVPAAVGDVRVRLVRPPGDDRPAARGHRAG
ncbi:MAG: acetyl esterase, partial [Nocardioidaceae bacterium]|nr:acetyl esterase [Nocardioidaceae bacterium]